MKFERHVYEIIEDAPIDKKGKSRLIFQIGDRILNKFYTPCTIKQLKLPIPNQFEILKYELLKSNLFQFYYEVFFTALNEKLITKIQFEILIKNLNLLLEKESKYIQKKQPEDLAADRLEQQVMMKNILYCESSAPLRLYPSPPRERVLKCSAPTEFDLFLQDAIEYLKIQHIRENRLSNFVIESRREGLLNFPIKKGTNIVLLNEKDISTFIEALKWILTDVRVRHAEIFRAVIELRVGHLKINLAKNREKGDSKFLEMTIDKERTCKILLPDKRSHFKVFLNQLNSAGLFIFSEKIFLTKKDMINIFRQIIVEKGFKKYISRRSKIYKIQDKFEIYFKELSDSNFYSLFARNQLNLKYFSQQLVIKRNFNEISYLSLTTEEIFKIILLVECIFARFNKSFFVMDDIEDLFEDKEAVFNFIAKNFANTQLILLSKNRYIQNLISNANVISRLDL